MKKNNTNNNIYILFMNDEKNQLCDYVQQTARILSKKHFVIIAYYLESYSLFFILKNLGKFFSMLLKWKRILLSEKAGVYDLEFISILPFQRLENIYKLNMKLIWSELQFVLFLKKTLSLNWEKIVCWIFHPSAGPIVRKNSRTICLYDFLDYFESWPSDKEDLKDQTNRLIKKADFVFANSNNLALTKRDIRKDIVEVPCGCAVDIFPLDFFMKKKPLLLNNINSPIMGYIGHIDYRIDFNLIEHILKTNKDINLVFIGKVLNTFFGNQTNYNKDVLPNMKKLQKYLNFHLVSEVTKQELKNYLYYFDIAIIPYNIRHKFVYYSNPMKFYEYLAMDVPVVSVPIPSLLKYEMPVVRFGKTHEEFDKHIKYLIKHPELATKYKTQMRKIAEDNSWEKKVEEIQKHISLNS
ncbi:MAG: hypothetical protein A2857_02195 [Candidatus Levybacteria bacterium RIFCSPHIGHO2_01_FULL_36_15]|nr:MAG: hypothetical protein A2857_02195 [Candidatus Levybacteria bacterium RIFCSPHIGHO2_01_FULL_36_15]